MLQKEQPGLKTYCNCVAQEKGLDPGGHATAFDTLILLEAPLPWRRDVYDAAGTLPQEVIDLHQLYLQRYYETGVWAAPYVFLIAPDATYSRPGWRRLMHYRKPGALMSDYSCAEYWLPDDQAGALVWALVEAPDALGDFDQWRIEHERPPRDLLVCTHGAVDAACAKFGFPLYHHLRQGYAAEHLRVWRISHFGGHVFAPTLLDMPSGRSWGYVGEAQAAAIAHEAGPLADLRGHYRGWAALENGFLQAAEREILLREGWRWLHLPKQGILLAQEGGDDPAWAEVRIEFDDGGPQAYTARVEVTNRIEMIHTTGYDETYPYPQYVVTHLERSQT